MKDISEVTPHQTECPICGSEITYYTVTNLGGGGPVDRHIGCRAEDGTCLLAKKSWTMKQWDELCSMIDSAGEGYPGAAHDTIELRAVLVALVKAWKANADVFASVSPGPAGATFLYCAEELNRALIRMKIMGNNGLEDGL